MKLAIHPATSSPNKLIKRLSLVSATSLLLGACALSPFADKPTPSSQIELRSFSNTDEAVVYFYRPRNSLSGFGEKNPPNIYVNKKLVGELPNGRFKSTLIKELENKTISIHKSSKDNSFSSVILQQDVDMSGAARYFVKVNYNLGDTEPDLVLVSEAVALEDMAKLKAMADSEE
ncbi:MAG: hypothetical protein JKY67_04780 [Pseudomonadales bacterium]|nr:hypothetical protein [Pseudomonadales bacterium]